MSQKRFNFRSFTTLILAWTFLALIGSGVVLYISPPGRIANWSDWRIVALTKQQWQAIHTLSAIVFLTGGLFHLLKFNWKVFVAYLKRRTHTRLQFKWELGGSLLLFAVVTAGTIAGVQPFQQVMVTGERLKESWGNPDTAPPVPHLELQRFEDVAASLELPTEKAVQVLKSKGMEPPAPDTPLRDVARVGNRSPREVFETLREASGKAPEAVAAAAQSHAPGSGSGLGGQRLADVAAGLGLSRDDAVAVLAGGGVAAGADEDLRTIAFRQGKRPFEIVELLRKGAADRTTEPSN